MEGETYGATSAGTVDRPKLSTEDDLELESVRQSYTLDCNNYGFSLQSPARRHPGMHDQMRWRKEKGPV